MSMIALVTTLAAGLLGIVGVLVGERRGSRSQRDHWLRDAQLHACARLTDELDNVNVALAEVRRGTRQDLDWAPFNQGLTAVSLICESPVIEDAYRLDGAVWRAHRTVLRRNADDAEWRELRQSIDASRRDFIASARRQLAPRSTTPTVLSGRPPDDDPIWHLGKAP